MKELEGSVITVRLNHKSYLEDADMLSGYIEANFAWPEGKPESTYTIVVNRYVSIEFDKAFPVRPTGIRIYAPGSRYSAETLGMFLGNDLVSVILNSEANNNSLRTRLSFSNRMWLAELQASSPSTPLFLKVACHNLLTVNLKSELSIDKLIRNEEEIRISKKSYNGN